MTATSPEAIQNGKTGGTPGRDLQEKSHLPRLGRRQIVRAGFALSCSLGAPLAIRADPGPLRIGRLAFVGGPAGWGQVESYLGVRAAVEEVNSRGGVSGRSIELVSVEDSATSRDAAALCQRMIERDRVVAFTGGNSQTVAAIMPVLAQARVPLVGPVTGLDSLRTPNPYVFWTRPTYGQEIEKIVLHLATTGQQRCAVTYTNDEIGRALIESFRNAAARAGNAEWREFLLGNEVSAIAEVVEKARSWEPTSLMSLAAGPFAIPYFRAMRSRIRVPTYNYSAIGSKPILEALGDHAKGLVIAQVVPHPNLVALKAVRDYGVAMRRLHTNNVELSFTSLEGYIAARVLIEGLRRAGGDRAGLVASLESMSPFDLGGFEVRYSNSSRTGSRFVELTYYDGVRFLR